MKFRISDFEFRIGQSEIGNRQSATGWLIPQAHVGFRIPGFGSDNPQSAIRSPQSKGVGG